MSINYRNVYSYFYVTAEAISTETQQTTINIPTQSTEELSVCGIAEEEENSYNSVQTTVSSSLFSTRDLVCWSFQIAKGMDYLATKKVPSLLFNCFVYKNINSYSKRR